ncbi:MAG: c-type cytochrome [candidate division WOR-3 bacterium]
MMKTKIMINVAFFLFLLSCQSSKTEIKEENKQVQNEVVSDIGIGPIKEVKLGPIDQSLVSKGKEVFEMKCTACHKLDERFVGPPLRGITKKRKPEWIMNMILNPVEMTQKDPIAKQLLAEYLTQMTFQNVSQEEARAILEYFRSIDEEQK